MTAARLVRQAASVCPDYFDLLRAVPNDDVVAPGFEGLVDDVACAVIPFDLDAAHAVEGAQAKVGDRRVEGNEAVGDGICTP